VAFYRAWKDWRREMSLETLFYRRGLRLRESTRTDGLGILWVELRRVKAIALSALGVLTLRGFLHDPSHVMLGMRRFCAGPENVPALPSLLGVHGCVERARCACVRPRRPSPVVLPPRWVTPLRRTSGPKSRVDVIRGNSRCLSAKRS